MAPDMTKREPVELVCFDLGRVLVGVRDSWIEVFRTAGVELPLRLADADVRTACAELMRRAGVGSIEARQLFAELAMLVGVSVDEAMAVSSAAIIGTIDGVRELIDDLQAGDARTACLSNTHQHHWDMLMRDGRYSWIRRLDHRFASHLIGHAKPDPAVYKHVERATAIAPARILFFDDVAEHCDAARCRGWKAEPIDPAGDTVAQLRDHLTRHNVLGRPKT